MRAIMVCVDYWDLLELTLPYNRHHFDELMIVTCLRDERTVQVANRYGVIPFITEAFYDDGADFNKFKAMEQGLDVFGRRGLMVIMDPDVLWPKRLPDCDFAHGCLYTPRRRMLEAIPDSVPDESNWHQYPLHRQEREWAGYTQIFHADDPVLPEPPWHQTNWRHAGGADSFFQCLWPPERKIRPGWHVLHLGARGSNWCGRSTPYRDGTLPPNARERAQRVRGYITQRARSRRTGDPYAHERLPRQP